MDAIIGTAKHMESLAKGQIAAAENRVVPLAQQVAALEAENAALKAPVSDEEWGVIYDKAPSWVQGYSYLRAKINALITARAKETP